MTLPEHWQQAATLECSRSNYGRRKTRSKLSNIARQKNNSRKNKVRTDQNVLAFSQSVWKMWSSQNFSDRYIPVGQYIKNKHGPRPQRKPSTQMRSIHSSPMRINLTCQSVHVIKWLLRELRVLWISLTWIMTMCLRFSEHLSALHEYQTERGIL